MACLATGPSLTQEDVTFLRGRVDGVVAINDAHRLAPWADVLYSSDRRWWNHYKGVPEFTGMKYGVGSGTGKQNPYAKCPDVVVLKNTGYDGIETNPTALRTGRNSGFAAVNLAVHLGAKRILLLGYNLGYRNGRAHFFGNHPAGLTQTTGLYPGFRRSFDRVAPVLAGMGIEVVNCTPQSSLSAFPLKTLREALAKPAVAA